MRAAAAVERDGEGEALCLSCGKLESVDTGRCGRCGAAVSRRKPYSLQRTMAWLVTAAILYVPANAWPIMTTAQLGRARESTIVGGVIQLWGHGSYLVAAIIFVASVLVPLAKVMALGWLCWICSAGYRFSRAEHTRLYGLTELFGRWSMIDVCVVAVLVALVQMGGLLRIEAGPAGLAFAGVVIATMVAAHSFDPRLIWDAIERREREREGSDG